MLTQIDVVYGNDQGEQALALPILGVTPKESLLIRKVTGLNPPAIDLFIGDYARDGGLYQGRRVGKKNVVLTIDLNPNPALGETVSGLRSLLYKTFLDPLVDADHIELVLRSDDGQVRNLYGYTETLETELFDVETMAQVSIICPDPYIRDLAETSMTNESGTWLLVNFVYNGTAETGFEAELHVSADTPTVTIANNGKTMVITGQTFSVGTAIYVNTNRGYRDIRSATITQANAIRTANPSWTLNQVWAQLLANGTAQPLLSRLTTTSRWIELHSQANTLKAYGAQPTDSNVGVKHFAYRASYWGL